MAQGSTDQFTTEQILPVRDRDNDCEMEITFQFETNLGSWSPEFDISFFFESYTELITN